MWRRAAWTMNNDVYNYFDSSRKPQKQKHVQCYTENNTVSPVRVYEVYDIFFCFIHKYIIPMNAR